jgi:hypothetical protein
MSARVELRAVTAEDLPIIYEQQRDPVAAGRAGFKPRRALKDVRRSGRSGAYGPG